MVRPRTPSAKTTSRSRKRGATLIATYCGRDAAWSSNGAGSQRQRDLAAFADGALGFQADDDALARLLAADERAALAKRHHRGRDLLAELDDFARALDRDRLRARLAAPLHLELEARRVCPVLVARPPGADRALGAGDLHRLVILEAR